MVFEGTKEVYERFIVSIPMGKKEKEICEFVEDFKNFSCHCTNLSNDYII